jgi:hypothetical protein
LRWAHRSGCLGHGVVPTGRTTPLVVWEVVVDRGWVVWSHRDGFPGVRLVWSGWSVGVGVGRWGCCGCGGLIGRVVWAMGWFPPAVPHPVVVWEVVAGRGCVEPDAPAGLPHASAITFDIMGTHGHIGHFTSPQVRTHILGLGMV